ncbi:transposase domain-containing protein [Nocardia sp. NPDC052278]|uniref:transposase domain-containing protein n=1 Tax=unclassified Nocardia TaxID=2637762 RepID=UPI0036BDC8B7
MTDRIGLGVLTRVVRPDLVDEVLVQTGRCEKRRRLLPARVVVYFVLAMTLFFDHAYEKVMRKLVDGLGVSAVVERGLAGADLPGVAQGPGPPR